MALWFEEFTPGREFVTGRRAVTDEDIAAFAHVSGDRNRLHLDEAHARGTLFHGRIAHGALGIAMATGLWSQTGVTEGTLVALLGIDWHFIAPVRPGDVLMLRVQVADARLPEGRHKRDGPEAIGQGIVRLACRLLNQRDEVVQEGVLTELIRTRQSVGGSSS